jgi:hypothetical protein
MPTRASRNSLDSYTACEPSASGHSEADRREQLMVDNGLVDGQATSRREILVLHASKPSRATSSGVDRTTLSNFCPDPGKPVYRAWCCPDVLVRHEAAMVDYQRALGLLRRVGNRRIEIDIRVGLSNIYHFYHRPKQAIDPINQARALELDDRASQTICLATTFRMPPR